MEGGDSDSDDAGVSIAGVELDRRKILAALTGAGVGAGSVVAAAFASLTRQTGVSQSESTPTFRPTPTEPSQTEQTETESPTPRGPPVEEVLDALSEGGYNVYVRHESTQNGTDQFKEVDASPFEMPEWEFDDPTLQRNLSVGGWRRAARVGSVLERFDPPVGEVLTSPFTRCRKTASLYFGEAEVTNDLNFASQDVDDNAVRQLQRSPEDGANRFLFAHSLGSVGLDDLGVESFGEGDMIVIDPTEPVSSSVVRRLTPVELIEGIQERSLGESD
jgi:hypothetical protein